MANLAWTGRPRVAPCGLAAARVWLLVAAPAVLYTVLLWLVLHIYPVVLRALAVPRTPRTDTAVFLGGILLVEALAFALLLAWLRHEGRSLADLGWGRSTTASALGLGVAVGLGYAGLTLANPAVGAHAAELSLFKAWGVLIGVAGGTVEEIIFRGFVMSELERWHVSAPAQVLASSVAFAAIHGYSSLWGSLFTAGLGAALAGLYLFGRRSLTPTVLSHGLINLLIEPWLLLWYVSVFGVVR
ncbi:MAG TPA: CPBP family intramembrane glutamic endopeptidase [Chloroflexota bacterium]|nr:CPBP family intramembrane glutamic endopeptidase [Chloroflexota bacterium]